MNCGVVFYDARKTSACERALKKRFSELDLTLTDTLFATNSVGLGEILISLFDKSDVVFVIGGLGFSDNRGIKNIISRAMYDAEVDEIKKLNNDFGDDGYVLKSKNQFLVLLPDEPEQIDSVMDGPVGKYITSVKCSPHL